MSMERVENKHGFDIQTSEDGFTLLIPATGFRTIQPSLLLVLVLACGCFLLFGTLIYQLLHAESWLSWWLWFSGVFFVGVLLRALFAILLHRVHLPLTCGKIVVNSHSLTIRWGILRAYRQRRWQTNTIQAIDEEDGALGVLADSGLESFFAGRDREDLLWIASTLRRALGVPAEVPGLEGEIAVSYHFPEWAHPRRGFVSITQGRMRLRPRFDLTSGLVFRPRSSSEANGGLTQTNRPNAGTVFIDPADVRWGIGVGGIPVLRIWLQDPYSGQPVSLEITSDRLQDVRLAMSLLWSPE